jgi:uncharacterized protein (UPF0332 family)
MRPHGLILERTGKVVRRHRGVQNELRRLTKDEPHFEPELRVFLARAYNLKAVADYQTGPEANVPAETARPAIDTARQLVGRITEMLSRSLR